MPQWQCVGLFILELFNVAAFAFGGSAGASVAFFEGILTHHLYTFVFLLRGEVGHEVLDKFGADPVAEGLPYLDDTVQLLDGDFVYLASLDFVRGFERLPVHAYMPAAAGISSKAARLVETHSPEIFVYADGFVHGLSCCGRRM